jgi:PPIC-type PPIASE domain
MGKKSKISAAIAIVIVIGIIFMAGSWAWLANGQISPLKEKVYSVLPFPAAIVNGQVVTTRQFILRYELAQKFSGQNGAANDADLKHNVFLRLLEESKLYSLAKDKAVTPTQDQIEAEFDARLSSTSGNSLKTALAAYGIGEKTYKNELVKADVAAANITAWYFGQKDLNPPSYQKAEEITQKLNAGEPMASLARAYSKDPQSQSLGGDEGFLEEGSLLPEIASSRPGLVWR